MVLRYTGPSYPACENEAYAKLRNLRVFSFRVKEKLPQSRMNDEEMIAKFKNNAVPVLKKAQIERIIETVCNLDKVETTGQLTSLLA